MAKNVKYDVFSSVQLEIDLGGAKSSGDLVLLNEMSVLCLTDTNDDDEATVVIPGVTIVADLSVTGADNGGNAAISVGNAIYDDSGTLNIDATDGTKIGYALEAVGSGSTETIMVALINN